MPVCKFTIICFPFAKKGVCKNGDLCRFKHDNSPEGIKAVEEREKELAEGRNNGKSGNKGRGKGKRGKGNA